MPIARKWSQNALVTEATVAAEKYRNEKGVTAGNEEATSFLVAYWNTHCKGKSLTYETHLSGTQHYPPPSIADRDYFLIVTGMILGEWTLQRLQEKEAKGEAKTYFLPT